MNTKKKCINKIKNRFLIKIKTKKTEEMSFVSLKLVQQKLGSWRPHIYAHACIHTDERMHAYPRTYTFKDSEETMQNNVIRYFINLFNFVANIFVRVRINEGQSQNKFDEDQNTKYTSILRNVVHKKIA